MIVAAPITDQIEGFAVSSSDIPLITYGGTDDNDNSGVLRYVSVRHGGAADLVAVAARALPERRVDHERDAARADQVRDRLAVAVRQLRDLRDVERVAGKQLAGRALVEERGGQGEHAAEHVGAEILDDVLRDRRHADARDVAQAPSRREQRHHGQHRDLAKEFLECDPSDGRKGCDDLCHDPVHG